MALINFSKLLYTVRAYFVTLAKLNIVYYKLTNYYKPKYERGINLMDKTLNIKWPGKKFKISTKDKNLGSFKDFLSNHNQL